MNLKKMTESQFLCCLFGRSTTRTKSAQAAQWVMVDGMSVKEAAEKSGLQVQSVRNAMVRINRRFKRLCAAGPWPSVPPDNQVHLSPVACPPASTPLIETVQD